MRTFWTSFCLPPPEDVHSALLRALCIGELLWRSAFTAGVSVCSSIQSCLHTDHTAVCYRERNQKIRLKG